MESELISAAHAPDEAVWFYNLCESTHMILPTNLSTTYDGDSRVMPVPILMGNVSAIQLANHPKSTQFSRHITMREFWIRGACETGFIRPMYCPRYFNISDKGPCVYNALIMACVSEVLRAILEKYCWYSP